MTRKLAAFAVLIVCVVVESPMACTSSPADTNSYTIAIDSVSVSNVNATTSAIRFHGWLANGCKSLQAVDKSTSGDSLVRRFIGTDSRSNCIQALIALDYTEQVASSPARTLVYVIREPTGASLVRSVTLPK